jgi:hypothetical protein
MVDRDQLLATFSNNAGDNADLIAVLTTAIDVCVNTDGTAAQTALPTATPIVRPVCNINSAAIYGCMHREVLLVGLKFVENVEDGNDHIYFSFCRTVPSTLLLIPRFVRLTKSLLPLVLHLRLHKLGWMIQNMSDSARR